MGLICGHWDAVAQRRMVRVGDGSHNHVVALGVLTVHTAHHDVRMINLTASTELLGRLRVNDIPITNRNRHSLRLIEDGGNAQACQTKIVMNHNE